MAHPYAREANLAATRRRASRDAFAMTLPTGESTDDTSRRPLVLDGIDDLKSRVGTELGVSDWRTIRQEDVSTFARLTVTNSDPRWTLSARRRAHSGQRSPMVS